MAGVLRFSEYLGGPDNIQVEEIFPSSKRTYQYDFNQDITSWTWVLKAQTIVVSPVTWDKYSGEPNFANSLVIGSFASNTYTVDNTILNIVSAAAGTVNLTIPANLYTGPVIPDARSKVPISIVKFQWTTADSPTQVNSHRWAFIQCYEPGVTIGDPTGAAGYTALSIS